MPNQSWCELLVSAPVAGTAITAAAATSLLPAQAVYTLPPSFSRLGSQYHIHATGIITSLITTPGTARFDVRFGAVTVFDSLAILLDSVAAHTDVGWVLDIWLTVRAIGNGVNSNLIGQGTWTCEDILGVPATAPKGCLTAILPWNSAPAVGASFDSTLSTNAVDLRFTQTAATGSCQLLTYSLFALN